MGVCDQKQRFETWLSIHCNELRHGDYGFLDRAGSTDIEALDELLRLMFEVGIRSFMADVLRGGFCCRDLLVQHANKASPNGIEEARSVYLSLVDNEREFVDRFFSRFMNRTPWNYFQYGLGA